MQIKDLSSVTILDNSDVLVLDNKDGQTRKITVEDLCKQVIDKIASQSTSVTVAKQSVVDSKALYDAIHQETVNASIASSALSSFRLKNVVKFTGLHLCVFCIQAVVGTMSYNTAIINGMPYAGNQQIPIACYDGYRSNATVNAVLIGDSIQIANATTTLQSGDVILLSGAYRYYDQ